MNELTALIVSLHFLFRYSNDCLFGLLPGELVDNIESVLRYHGMVGRDYQLPDGKVRPMIHFSRRSAECRVADYPPGQGAILYHRAAVC